MEGSHHHVAFSPNGQFLVTAMQEPALHGWRVVDAKHMRMSGYSARVRSFGWTAGGKWLATSGSEQLVLWPFQGKDGPMGKQPKMFARVCGARHRGRLSSKQEVVAAGYADGTVLLVRIEDGAEVLGKRPGDGPFTALGWDAPAHCSLGAPKPARPAWSISASGAAIALSRRTRVRSVLILVQGIESYNFVDERRCPYEPYLGFVGVLGRNTARVDP